MNNALLTVVIRACSEPAGMPVTHRYNERFYLGAEMHLVPVGGKWLIPTYGSEVVSE